MTVCINRIIFFTVTSRLFTHIVSTEKVRKDMRDRKDMRGMKYTNLLHFNSCFFDIASYLNQSRDFPTFNNLFTFIYKHENKR